MNRLFILAIAVLAGALIASPANAAKHTKDSLKTIQKNIKDKKKAVLIDVREKREWDGGHLEQATLVSMSDIKDSKKIKDVLKKLPKDKKTIVYCH